MFQAWIDPHPLQVPALSDSPGVIASPSERTYINASYNAASQKAGIGWTTVAPLNTRKAYDWDPATYFADIPDDRIVGVAACLWGDLITDRSRYDELLLPRLPGFGELGWSPRATHSWQSYRSRLATQAPRWDAWGMPYYPDPLVPWAKGSTTD